MVYESNFDLYGDDIDESRLSDPKMRREYEKMRIDVDMEQYIVAHKSWKEYATQLSDDLMMKMKENIFEDYDGDQEHDIAKLAKKLKYVDSVVECLAQKIDDLKLSKRILIFANFDSDIPPILGLGIPVLYSTKRYAY